jgi:hypothetical protein
MAKLPLRLRALDRAKKEIGVTESPPNSNWGPRVSQYIRSTGYDFPLPWCLAFVHWCYDREGFHLGGKALVQAFDNWAYQNGFLVKRPLKGDIVCYDWEGNNWDDHVGIVDKVLALRWRGDKFVGWVRTVEGNTSYGNDSNGGKVMIRYRWINHAKFARIPG